MATFFSIPSSGVSCLIAEGVRADLGVLWCALQSFPLFVLGSGFASDLLSDLSLLYIWKKSRCVLIMGTIPEMFCYFNRNLGMSKIKLLDTDGQNE